MENKELESKAHNLNGSEFTFKYDKSLFKKKKNRLLKKYFALQSEFTGDIDLNPVKKHQERISELETALAQSTDEARITEYQTKLDEAKKNFENDTKAQSIQTYKNNCEGLILKEIAEDTEFIKPFLSEILTGDVESIDYDAEEATIFIMGVINDFLDITTPSKPKS